MAYTDPRLRPFIKVERALKRDKKYKEMQARMKQLVKAYEKAQLVMDKYEDKLNRYMDDFYSNHGV